MKKVFFLLIAVIIVIWGIWIAFPVTAMESIIEDSINNQKVVITVKAFKKGLFYSLYADNIALKSAKSDLISLNSVHATINPLRLMALRMDMSVYGRLGEGIFSGDASLSRKMVTMNLDFRQARLRDLQFLAIMGIRGKGTVSGHTTMIDQKGHMNFLVNDAEIEPLVFQGVSAPLNFFRTINGSVDIERNNVHLASISLEGPNVFARLRGDIKDGVMDLRMEVMPQKLFLENPLFLSQVDKYQVSPGYYVIPIKGPLVF